MLSDFQRGVDLAQSAARALVDAGSAYGFALAAALPMPDTMLTAHEALRGPLPKEQTRPEQLLHHALACALLGDEFAFVHAMIELDVQARGRMVLPVGPLGLPLSLMVDALMTDALAPDALAPSLTPSLWGAPFPAEFLVRDAVRRRAQSLALARANTYLWKAGRSPVAYLDLPLVVLLRALLALDKIDKDDLRNAVERQIAPPGLWPVIAAPVNAAIRLAGGEALWPE